MMKMMEKPLAEILMYVIVMSIMPKLMAKSLIEMVA